MATVVFVAAFIAAGIAVAFVAYSGGPSQAREAYLTKGRRGFKIAIPIVYIALGIAVPALVLANKPEAKGSQGALASENGGKDFDDGKKLFRENCWSCHTLAAAGARGNTGPSLDALGEVDTQRIVTAIRIGGSGSGRMPANLVQGACEKQPCHGKGEELTDAEKLAVYVAEVAGR